MNERKYTKKEKELCKLIGIQKSIKSQETLDKISSELEKVVIDYIIPNPDIEFKVKIKIAEKLRAKANQISEIVEELRKQDILITIAGDDFEDNPYPQDTEDEKKRMDEVNSEINNFDFEDFKKSIGK